MKHWPGIWNQKMHIKILKMSLENIHQSCVDVRSHPFRKHALETILQSILKKRQRTSTYW